MFKIVVGSASNGTIEVALFGRLVLGQPTSRLREVLASLAGAYGRVVLDCQALKQIDSSGVGELVSCHAVASGQGTRLQVRNMTGQVREVLLLVKLLTVLEDEQPAAA